MSLPARYTVFAGHRRLASGPLVDVARAAVRHRAAADPILVFDDATGQVVDLDLRGSERDVVARLAATAPDDADAAPAAPRRRGRPRLGVVAREVTLLPRHWAWLAAQPGGASVTLRRLVEEARRARDGATRARQVRDAAYHFMHAIAGDLAGFEEASRALFAGDRARVATCVADWPPDVRDHLRRLLDGGAD